MIDFMSDKVVIKLNASSLPYTKCMLRWHRTVIDGYQQPVKPARMVYGISGHKYIDSMFKTHGDIGLSRDAALKAFRVPKSDHRTQMYLSSETHFLPVCYNVWEEWVEKDSSFDLILLPNNEPATEFSFSIRYYEDEWVIVDLEGTIDRIGRFKGGCFAIGDYKFTSSYDSDSYLADYEMSPQLLFYITALKIAAEIAPQSMIGQIGATNVGAFVDGIFLKAKAIDTTYQRSKVFQYKPETLAQFRIGIDRIVQKLSAAIRDNTWNVPEGIVNGACQEKFSKCDFWYVCRTQDEKIGEILLNRDFIKKVYSPLHHNE